MNKWNVFNYDYKFIVYLFFTMPFIFVSAYIFTTIKSIRLHGILGFCGLITLEVYLFQEKITIVVTAILKRIPISLDSYGIITNIIAVTVTVLCAYMWHKICEDFQRKRAL